MSEGTVIHAGALDPNPVDDFESLRELVEDMDAGKVEMLVIVGGNPVYNAPVDFVFAQRIIESQSCASTWAFTQTKLRNFASGTISRAHFPRDLEAMPEAFDGSATINTAADLAALLVRSVHELLAAFECRRPTRRHTRL